MAKRMLGLGAGLTLLLAAALPAAPAAAQEAGPSAPRDERQTAVLPGDYLAGAWWLYKSAMVENGRVIDRSNGGVSHSEGQGYGMLIAVAADDREGFDALWAWTRKALMIRGDALAAWKWDPNAAVHVADQNNASDGDLLIAWALSRAARAWNEPAFAQEAKAILKDLVAKAVIDDRTWGKILLPAAEGFSGTAEEPSPVVNPSYWVFPALRELGRLDATFPAEELIRSGNRLIEDGRFGSSDLPADWLSLTPDHLRPAPSRAATFGYEAVRVPLYAAWYGRPLVSLLKGLEKRWNRDGDHVLHVMDLASADPLIAMPDPGYRAVSELLSCSLKTTTQARIIPAFEVTEYYPSTLHLLSIVAISERYPECLAYQN